MNFIYVALTPAVLASFVSYFIFSLLEKRSGLLSRINSAVTYKEDKREFFYAICCLLLCLGYLLLLILLPSYLQTNNIIYEIVFCIMCGVTHGFVTCMSYKVLPKINQ